MTKQSTIRAALEAALAAEYPGLGGARSPHLSYDEWRAHQRKIIKAIKERLKESNK